FGISGDITVDYGAAYDRSRKVSDGIVKGIHFLMKKNKITEINGYGRFTDAKTIEVDGTSYTFDNCVIATGSVVKTLPGVELSENVVSYEEQILSRDIPGSMVIVGAGAIGMEFAYILANYGVDVTMVEFMDRALPNEDEEDSKEITKQYKKLGVTLLTATKTTAVRDNGDSVEVDVEGKDGGDAQTLTVDKVLMAVGLDRKSTRLNSSHVSISYAVFCLKKNKGEE